MEDKINYTIPLGNLLKVLKESGYEISTKQVLEIQTVLLSSSLSKLNPSDLKYIITPVLARNEEDQRNIYEIIDSFITAGRPITMKKQSLFNRWFKNRKFVFRLKVAAFTLVVITGLLFYFIPKKKIPKTPASSLMLPPGAKKDTLQSDITSNILKDSILRQRETIQAPGPFNVNGPLYNGEEIIPVARDINLQVSLAFGLGLGAILYYLIFFDEKKRMKIKEKKRSEERNIVTDKREEKTGLPVEGERQWQPNIIQFPESDYLIHKSREFFAIRANLKKPAFIEFPDLDVAESAHATARKAGFPSLLYNNEWKERKYLLLTNNEENDTHTKRLLNFLVRQLTSDKTPVIKYNYTTDITTLKESTGKITSLEDLSHRFRNYHLIIIDNCTSFFEPGIPFLKNNYSEIFTRWPHKSVITPTPLPDWTYREKQLQKNEFIIVPADMNAVKLLAKAISENAFLTEERLKKQLKDTYSVSGFNFQTTDGLKSYLNNDTLFQMVCSLAVYPRLDWSLTLMLFTAILKENTGSVKLDYDTLLKVSRIPWMATNKLDESVRLSLLHQLNPKTEIIARETILKLLDEVRPATDATSAASHELDVQYRLNSFFLYVYDPYLYHHFADVKKNIAVYWDNLNDWALKERVNSRISGLMPINKEGQRSNVEEFVLEEEKFEKTNMNFLRVMVLTIPAIILYIFFSLSRPSAIYLDQYKDVSFTLVINKNEICEKQLTGLVIEGKQESYRKELNILSSSDTVQINNVKYNENLNISLLSADGKSVDLMIRPTHSLVSVSAECN